MTTESVSASLRESLSESYRHVRACTEALASTITAEDAQVQSMDDVSPAKWHLGHVSWFFETFVLRERPGYVSPHDEFKVLFNSYYDTVGDKHPRPRRGFLTRPSLSTVYDYRHSVDDAVQHFLETATDEDVASVAPVLTVGLHHEQQHQELMMTDILHVYWCNPLRPAYSEQRRAPSSAGFRTPLPRLRRRHLPGGLRRGGLRVRQRVPAPPPVRARVRARLATRHGR